MTKRAYFNIDETQSVRCIQSSIIMTSSTKPATRRLISQQKIFQCRQQNCSESCKICHGVGSIFGSHNFVRFVESIIDFKTSNRTTESQITQCMELNFSQIVKNTEKSAFQTRSYTRQSFITPMRSSYQPPKKQSVHLGIQCDKCHEYPIVGRRYTCQQCQNYDLCQRCYVIHDHQHNIFQQVKQTKSELMKERLREKAKQLNDNNMARVSRIIRTMGSLC